MARRSGRAVGASTAERGRRGRGEAVVPPWAGHCSLRPPVVARRRPRGGAAARRQRALRLAAARRAHRRLRADAAHRRLGSPPACGRLIVGRTTPGGPRPVPPSFPVYLPFLLFSPLIP